MKRAAGFTLVELLVVIAIISILAGIIVPQVSRHISNARMSRTMAEINGIELALTQMMTDANVQSLRHLFQDAALPETGFSDPPTDAELAAAADTYSRAFYILLRQGRDATGMPIALKPELKKKLSESYMELGQDQWNNRYMIYPGPWQDKHGVVPFRSFVFTDTYDPGTDLYVPYVYDAAARTAKEAEIPGNPPVDDAYGFPAPDDLPFYVWSPGANMLSDQLFNSPADEEYRGGGDDINNWDTEGGWTYWYN